MQTNNELVVIKHALKDMNGNLLGVRFRCGYAVVAKNSKIYNSLKQLPLIKGQPDLPISVLMNTSFISRPMDVLTIYGKEAYNAYMQYVEEKLAADKQHAREEAQIAHLEENKCAYQVDKNSMCSHSKVEPSKYCSRHILEDKELIEKLKIKMPSRLTYEEQISWRAKVLKKIRK